MASSQDLFSSMVSRMDTAGDKWLAILSFLATQSNETLAEMHEETIGYSPLEWEALGFTLSQYHLHERGMGGTIPIHEFYLKVAVKMVPMLVIDYGTSGQDSDGIARDVYAYIDAMTDSMDSDERTLALCCGFYLSGVYSIGGGLSDEALQWISDHAVEVIKAPHSFFADKKFDHHLAERQLEVESVPMRQGVL